MSVALKPDGIVINGQPVVVLASSLFYFRIPRGLWRDRMMKIRRSGYNTVDVYFPWNYHEVAEGKWNFQGERDVADFLHQAFEAGLWVIARPGPYICSEWDGGGLPAYLFTKPGLRLRDNDPRYLRYVSGWFDRILPILAPFQADAGGNVIAVQLENELDFYDCHDRSGYMTALRNMARANDIRVPLIACAGQGDLRGASGNVTGIVPTCNIYNADTDPGVEQRAYTFYERMQARGFPLCVTETNRSHFFLRRLLSAGARLIGPYLQAGGVNFGFTNAVNNWGQPLAFLTSDYDFGGMVAADGSIREEFQEAVLFTGMIKACGKGLAQARPVRLPADALRGDLPAVDGGPYGLALADGGWLIALPNIHARPCSASLHWQDLAFPSHSELVIAAQQCPLLPFDMSLARWGFEGKLVYATAELAQAELKEDYLALVFAGERSVEIAMQLPEGVDINAGGLELHRDGPRCTLVGSAEPSTGARVLYPDGRVLALHVFDRSMLMQSGLPLKVTASGHLALLNDGQSLAGVVEMVSPDGELLDGQSLAVDWQDRTLDHMPVEILFQDSRSGTRAPSLEEAGILRGYGWYRAQVRGLEVGQVQGLLLQGAADVLSVYMNERYIATVTPGGGSAYLPVKDLPQRPIALEIRTEIWGHSNFDDSRLPALRLNATRGLTGAVAVLYERDLTPNWYIHLLDEAEDEDLYTALNVDTGNWPLVNFTGWLTTRAPNRVCYRKEIHIGAEQVDRWVLNFPGLTRPVNVSIGGSPFTRVSPLDPFLDISSEVHAGAAVSLVVYAEQDYHGQLSARVILLEGKAVEDWKIGGVDEDGLWTAFSAVAQSDEAGLRAARRLSVPGGKKPAERSPTQIAPGDIRLLWADLEETVGDRLVRFTGQNAKLTVFFNGHLVGRIWLDTGGIRPRMVGGAPDLIYLPGPWEQPGTNRLLVMLEAVHPLEPAEFGPVFMH